jgi:hypothetical protein
MGEAWREWRWTNVSCLVIKGQAELFLYREQLCRWFQNLALLAWPFLFSLCNAPHSSTNQIAVHWYTVSKRRSQFYIVLVFFKYIFTQNRTGKHYFEIFWWLNYQKLFKNGKLLQLAKMKFKIVNKQWRHMQTKRLFRNKKNRFVLVFLPLYNYSKQ